MRYRKKMGISIIYLSGVPTGIVVPCDSDSHGHNKRTRKRRNLDD